MSISFDAKFEVWLNEQLESIKSLSGFRRNRQLQQQEQSQPQQSARKELSQLQLGTASASYQSVVGRSDTGFFARHQNNTTSVTMSHAINGGGKHGGNYYYRFAYDDVDVQSLEDVDEELGNGDDDEERQRRRRLSRILGDQSLEFGSDAGLEMEDEFATTEPPLDENRNSFAGGRTSDPRANQYSTTSLDFSDDESFVSATGSDVTGSVTPSRNSGDWSQQVDGADHDGYAGGGLDGFVEFSRVRDENGNGVDRRAPDNDDGNDDDPLRYGVNQPLKSGNQGLLSAGLIAAISGRGKSDKRSAVDGNKLPTTKEMGARRMDDMVAVRFHKTDTGKSDVDPPGGEYMDDDEILVYPEKHQLPVRETRDVMTLTSGKMAASKDDGYASATRSFLPPDYSMDIISNDDGFSAGDMDDVSDASGLHSKDRDPIFKGSKRKTSSTPASPLHLARTISGKASDRVSRCGGRRRRLVIAGSVIGVVLLLVGVGIAIFLIVR